MKDALRVLVVEDDEDDLFLTQRELRKFVVPPIQHVEDGQHAIDYLAGSGAYADRVAFPFPDVMFLDLKMRHVNGLEVLDWVRINLPRSSLLIYMLTGSNEPRDREYVKASGVAAGYIVKPLTSTHLVNIFGAPPL
jgi:two-component system, response regulator